MRSTSSATPTTSRSIAPTSGGIATNWELAGERASIVVRHLQEQGVDPTRMRAVSAGQYHPVVANDSAAGRALNRRTAILLRPR